ncbi:hypothetical protein ACXZ1K_03390 [Pedobacter sp. PWIIR3]
MKTTSKTDKRTKISMPSSKFNPKYYFHADEDFREDWGWGKSKTIASNVVSRPVNQFEI